MSLAGSRSQIPYEAEQYPPHWLGGFAVKRGITSPGQVNGRSEVPPEEMIRLDLEHAHRRSLWFNVCLLARTVPTIKLNGQ